MANCWGHLASIDLAVDALDECFRPWLSKHVASTSGLGEIVHLEANTHEA